MKRLFNLILILLFCVPVSAEVSTDTLKDQLVQKALHAADIAEKMYEKARILAEDRHEDALKDFYNSEEMYWKDINDSLREYANEKDTETLKEYLRSFYEGWNDKRNEYTYKGPVLKVDSVYCAEASEASEKLTIVLDYKEGKATDNDAIDPQEHRNQDSSFSNLANAVREKEMQDESWYFVVVCLCTFAYVVIWCAIIAYFVRWLLKRKKKNPKVSAPKVKVKKDDDGESVFKQCNLGNKSKDILDILSNYFYIKDDADKEVKRYIEQKLTCAIKDFEAYKKQLVDFLYDNTSNDKLKEGIEELIVTPNKEQDETSEVTLRLPAIVKPDVVEKQNEQDVATTKCKVNKRTKKIAYLPWPAFSSNDEIADTAEVDTAKLTAGLIKQVDSLRKNITELHAYLGIKPAEEQSPIKESDDKPEEESIPTLEDEEQSASTSGSAEVLPSDGGIEDVPDTSNEAESPSYDSEVVLSLFEKVENALDSLESQVKDLDKTLKTSDGAYAELKGELEEIRKNYADANTQLADTNTQLAAVNSQLANAKDEKKRAVGEAEAKLKAEIKANNESHEKALEKAEKLRKAEVAAAQKESEEYRERLTFYPAVQKVAVEIVKIFDANYGAEYYLKRLGTLAKPEVVNDDFNYYLNRIRDKYARLMGEHAHKNFVLISELREVALRGLVSTGGVIDGWLKNTKPDKQEATLKQNLYNLLLRPYISATIIMADECAYLFPKMVPGAVSGKIVAEFTKCTNQVLEAAKKFGLKVVYVKPFDPMSKYKNVSNDRYAPEEVPINSGDIFEVLELAVNYGNSVSKTKVSAKK